MTSKKLLYRYNVLIEWDPKERVWITCVPSLNYLSTFGETREEALELTKEAILGYLESAKKEGIPVPPGDTDAELIKMEITAP